jgi:imidazolonepropionase-like amidohydrolase
MASFLLKDVRIFDGENTIDNGSVLVENGKISKVSSSGINFDGPTFSKPGHTVVPGFIDVHIHADHANPAVLPQSLRFGVTTVCDMHNEWQNILTLKEQMKGGDCADLKYTSFAATIDMGWPMPIVLAYNKDEATLAEIATWPRLVTPDDGRKYVQDRLKEGVHYIKLMHESGKVMGAEFNKPTLELQRAVIEEAHKNGLKVVAHSTCLDDTLEMLDAGVDGMTHTFIDQPPNERVIAAYKKANAHCNPTLAAMGSGTTEGQKTQERFAHDPRVEALIPEKKRQEMCMCMAFAKETGASFEHGFETVRQLKKAGVPVLW